jgi:hypothetical protein
MRRLPLVAILLAVVAAVAVTAGASPAGAGGWASASLDPLPAIAPGEAVPIGFTVRAHGATPVDLGLTQTPAAEAWWEERGVDPRAVGISIVDDAGEETFVPARAEGPVGHYVADVAFPSNGTYAWAVHQGIYGVWDLGTLHVTPDGATGAWRPTLAGPGADGSTTLMGQTVNDPIRAAMGSSATPAAASAGPAAPDSDARSPLALRLALPVIAVAAAAWLVRERRAAVRVPAAVGA